MGVVRVSYGARVDAALRGSFMNVGGYHREVGVPEGREKVAGGGASGTPGFLRPFSVRPGGAREWHRGVVPTGRPNDPFPGIARFSRPVGRIFWMLGFRRLRSFLAQPPADLSGSSRASVRAFEIHIW